MVNFLKKKFASSSETSGADVFNSVDVQMVNKKKKKKKKAKLLDQNHVFGQSLKSQIRSIRTSLLIQEDDATCSNGKRYVIYPKLLWLCLNWLENNADCTDTEGIFRLSGQVASLNLLKEQIVKGKYDNIPKSQDYESESDDDDDILSADADDEISNSTFREGQLIQKFLVYFYPSNGPQDSSHFTNLNRQTISTNLLEIIGMNFDEMFPQNKINNVSSLLKMYIRELPEPLMTFDHYDMFIASDGIPDDTVRLQVIRNVLRFLPRSNYFILKKLCRFLNSVHRKSAINKMDASNLAIVFAPNILRPPPMYCNVLQMQLSEATFATRLTQSLICEYDFFFENSGEPLNEQPKKPPKSFTSPKPPKRITEDASPTVTLNTPTTSTTTTTRPTPPLPTVGFSKPPVPQRKPSPSVFSPRTSSNDDLGASGLALPKPPAREPSRSVFVPNRSDTSKNVHMVIDSMNEVNNSKIATDEIRRLSRRMKEGDVCLDLTPTRPSQSPQDPIRKPLPPRRATLLTGNTTETVPSIPKFQKSQSQNTNSVVTPTFGSSTKPTIPPRSSSASTKPTISEPSSGKPLPSFTSTPTTKLPTTPTNGNGGSLKNNPFMKQNSNIPSISGAGKPPPPIPKKN